MSAHDVSEEHGRPAIECKHCFVPRSLSKGTLPTTSLENIVLRWTAPDRDPETIVVAGKQSVDTFSSLMRSILENWDTVLQRMADHYNYAKK